MMIRRDRHPRQLPLLRSFKREKPEHWLDKFERQAEEHEEALRRRALEPGDGRAKNFDAYPDRP